MSYSRFPLYVWSDGYMMHLWVQETADAKDCEMQIEPDDYGIQGGVNISEDLFDQLAEGQMRRKDGTPGRVRRSVDLDLASRQPDWLDRIIQDASMRLARWEK